MQHTEVYSIRNICMFLQLLTRVTQPDTFIWRDGYLTVFTLLNFLSSTWLVCKLSVEEIAKKPPTESENLWNLLIEFQSMIKLQLYQTIKMALCNSYSIPSLSVIIAEAESPPAENWADCPLLLWMLAVRENISSCSKMRSLLIVIEQAGVEEFPGPLSAVKVVRHVTPMKSPPVTKAPSVVAEPVFDIFGEFDLYIKFQIF